MTDKAASAHKADADLRIELLKTEYVSVSDEIRSRIMIYDAALGVGLSLIAGGVGLGISNNSHSTLIILPFAFFILVFYGLFQATGLLTLGGYRRALEERLNAEAGASVMHWESLVLDLRHTSLPVLLFYAIVAGSLVASIVGGLWAAASVSRSLVVGVGVGYLTLLAGVLVSGRRLLSASMTAYAEAKRRYLSHGG